MNIRQKTFLIFACIIVVFVLLGLFIVKPLFLEIKKTAASTMESREKLIALETIDKKYIEEMDEEYEIISRELALVRKQLVDKNSAVEFFEALEIVASSTSNEIEINASDFPVLTLNLFGTFPDAMKFLGWLENGDYFIDVASVNISKASAREGSELAPDGKINTNLKIKAYLND